MIFASPTAAMPCFRKRRDATSKIRSRVASLCSGAYRIGTSPIACNFPEWQDKHNAIERQSDRHLLRSRAGKARSPLALPAWQYDHTAINQTRRGSRSRENIMKSKTALVTRASSGFGEATAERLAKAGD